MRHLDEEIAKRKKVVERYREHLTGVKDIRLPAVQRDVETNYIYFSAVFDGFGVTRDEVFEELDA